MCRSTSWLLTHSPSLPYLTCIPHLHTSPPTRTLDPYPRPHGMGKPLPVGPPPWWYDSHAPPRKRDFADGGVDEHGHPLSPRKVRTSVLYQRWYQRWYQSSVGANELLVLSTVKSTVPTWYYLLSTVKARNFHHARLPTLVRFTCTLHGA